MQEIVMTFQIGDPGHCSDDDVIRIKAVRRSGGLTVDRCSKSLDIHTAANQVVLVGRAHPGLKHLITHAPRHHGESMTTFGSVLFERDVQLAQRPCLVAMERHAMHRMHDGGNAL